MKIRVCITFLLFLLASTNLLAYTVVWINPDYQMTVIGRVPEEFQAVGVPVFDIECNTVYSVQHIFKSIYSICCIFKTLPRY